jgi:hypothetical protein
MALWSALSDVGYEVNTLLQEPAVIGVTQTPLLAARPGLWDNGTPLRVQISRGALASFGEEAVLGGANAIAIGDGSSDLWEVMQFSEAELVAPLTYDLSRRLRGQAGSDAFMPDFWPVGSIVVLLNTALRQIDLPLSARGLARNYRIGSASRGTDDPAVVHRVEAFSGIGLRPLSPVHLRTTPQPNGDILINWTRRTRIDGDSWQSTEVPLGEDQEMYHLRIRANGAIVRDSQVTGAQWSYPLADAIADAAMGGLSVEVAQLSDRFGAGPYRTTDLTV